MSGKPGGGPPKPPSPVGAGGAVRFTPPALSAKANPPLFPTAATMSAPSAAPRPPLFGGNALADPDSLGPAAAAPVPPNLTGAADLTLGVRVQTYAATTWATFWDSIVKPGAAGLAITAAAFIVIGLVIAGPDVAAAFSTVSLAPLFQGAALRVLGLATALGVIGVSAWGFKDYFLAGRSYLLGRLTKNIPKDPKVLERTPAKYVRFYHGVLRWCGAFAFLCEAAFQLVAFALITWGVAVAFPGLGLFRNPDQLSVANAFLFWVEDAFALVDGPQTLGIEISSLEHNKAAWGFGLTLIFFKIVVVGLILQLVRASLTLRTADISADWQKAYERKD